MWFACDSLHTVRFQTVSSRSRSPLLRFDPPAFDSIRKLSLVFLLVGLGGLAGNLTVAYTSSPEEGRDRNKLITPEFLIYKSPSITHWPTLSPRSPPEFTWQSKYVAAIICGVLVFWCFVIVISTRKYKRYVELCTPIVQRRFQASDSGGRRWSRASKRNFEIFYLANLWSYSKLFSPITELAFDCDRCSSSHRLAGHCKVLLLSDHQSDHQLDRQKDRQLDSPVELPVWTPIIRWRDETPRACQSTSTCFF